MSIEETKEAIRVMQSFVDGNEVEYQISDGTWWDALTPSWNWASTRYRIKPTPVRYARELECELNAANDRIRLLIAERDTARRQAEQKYNLREEFRELLGTDDVEQGVAVVRELKQRINRLEEAGDAMAAWLSDPRNLGDDPFMSSQWHKAKEAKP